MHIVVTEQEAEVGVAIGVCSACGADVRADTLFCYNCGESLERPAKADIHRSDDKIVSAPSASNGSAAAEHAIKAGPGMRSAAAIRKEPKAFQRKPIKIAWEPSDGEPNFLLVLTSIIFLGFAVAAVALALYFK